MNYKISFSGQTIEPTTEEVGFYLGENLGEGYSVVEGKEKAIEHCKDVLFHFLSYTSLLIEKSREGKWANWESAIKNESAQCQKWSALLKKAMLLSLVLFAAPMFGQSSNLQSFKMCSAGVHEQVQNGFTYTPSEVSFADVCIEAPAEKAWIDDCAVYYYSRNGYSAKVSICGESAVLTADVQGCLYYIERPIQ